MNIVFWILIAVAVILTWMAASVIFPRFGNLVYHAYKRVKENLSYEEEDKEIKKGEEKNV